MAFNTKKFKNISETVADYFEPQFIDTVFYEVQDNDDGSIIISFFNHSKVVDVYVKDNNIINEKITNKNIIYLNDYINTEENFDLI